MCRQWCFAVLLVSAVGFAQSNRTPLTAGSPILPPTGTVTGRVLDEDTQRPIRFALVILQEKMTAGAGAEGGLTVTTRSDAEGHFVAASVAVGDYYVTAAAQGYLSEREHLQVGLRGGATASDLLARIPTIHVHADGTSSIDIPVKHGAAITGRLLWTDGSPVVGASMFAIRRKTDGIDSLPAELEGIQPGVRGSNSMTDDRGMYRIASIAPGEYLIRATIQSAEQSGVLGRTVTPGQQIMLYAPGVFRAPEATQVTLGAGEERPEMNIVVDLRAVRTVAGHVRAATAGQVVASGQANLVDSLDAELQFSSQVQIDGGFVFQYVPPGNYSLSITGSTTAASSHGRTDGVLFEPYTGAVLVGESDAKNLAIQLNTAPVQ